MKRFNFLNPTTATAKPKRTASTRTFMLVSLVSLVSVPAMAPLAWAAETAGAAVFSPDEMTGEDSIIPAAFRGDTWNSDLTILYQDLDEVLRQSVLVTGRSNRARVPKARPAAGSHIVRGTKGRSAMEGNRVLFPALHNQKNLALLSAIRKDLESVPDQLPLRLLKKEEQLAYWLNLYNVTLLEQIALIYPKSRLKGEFRGKNSLWDKKLLRVAGIDLSLNDIQHRIIIPKFKNPLVMYGMFQGFVGGPNIRNEAYTGEKVYDQLKENAREFVNSNRGMFMRERHLRVSHLYRVNEALFPNWERDLKKHLMHFANRNYRDRVRKSARIAPQTTDYNIADIYNGSAGRSSAYSTNPAAFLGAFEAVGYGSQASGDGGNGNSAVSGAFAGSDGGANAGIFTPQMTGASREGGRFPSHVMQYLMRIKARNDAKEGEVTIEELDRAPSTAKDDKPESQQHSTETLR